MRIPSGVVDQVVYFVAVDATDLKTRETGLTTFTVYRSRNGGAAAAMTTPTVTEVDATNMPGVYNLLLDEDMTIGAGNDSEEMVFHITQASMAPVTRSIELYRPKITVGNTLDVTATGAAGIDWGNVENASTTVDLSATSINLCDTVTTNTDMRGTDNALLAASAPTNFGDLAITVTTGQVTVGTNNDKTGYSISGSKTTLDALNDVSAADVNAQCDSAIETYGLDHLVSAAVIGTDIADNSIVAKLASKSATADWDSFDNTTDSLEAVSDSGGGGPTAAQIADAVWDEATVGHTTAGTFGEQVKTDIDAILADTNEIQGDLTDGGRLDLLIDAIKAVTDAIPEAGALTTIDANIDAILADTGTDGVVISATTANQIADAILNRDFASVSDTNARTALNALRAIRNKVSESGGTLTVTKEDDTTSAWTAAVTTDATADPITAVDPA